jgi:hypothetical protein
MRTFVFLGLLLAAVQAHAITGFLAAQWHKGLFTYCKYDTAEGSYVLTLRGVQMCATKIEL